jgi:sulfane dehydrogenase subunit SoxC
MLSIVTSKAAAETLADASPREVGADLSGHSERSKYVKITRIPEAGPGKRDVDPGDAINSKTPLDRLFGSITRSDLHYERSHSGVPDIDPAKHRLLVHGTVRKPLVFNVEDLKAMPSISRVVFIECTGNGWENWKKADENLTVQNTLVLSAPTNGSASALSF